MKKRKYSKSKLMMVGIFMYVCFQLTTMIISASTKTLVLENEIIEGKITTKGIIIRDEYLLKSPSKGTLKLIAEDKSKVKKSESVGYIERGNSNTEQNEKQIEDIKKEIEELSNQYKDESLALTKDALDMQIKTKEEQLKVLKYQISKNISYLTTSQSGVLSYKYDGKESKYNLDMLDTVTADMIDGESNDYTTIASSGKKIKESDPVVRVIDNNKVYIAIAVDNDKAEYFNLDKNIKIRLDGKIINGKVDKVNQNKGNSVIIFKITDQNVEIYDTRVQEFDIIYKQIEGYKIPKKSIKEVDDKKGVYVVDEETKKVNFIEIKGIEYEDEDFVFIDYYKNYINNLDTISLYDQIILKPNSINTKIKMK